jgi:hypothetical protein
MESKENSPGEMLQWVVLGDIQTGMHETSCRQAHAPCGTIGSPFMVICNPNKPKTDRQAREKRERER